MIAVDQHPALGQRVLGGMAEAEARRAHPDRRQHREPVATPRTALGDEDELLESA